MREICPITPTAWIEEYIGVGNRKFDVDAFNETGRTLARALKEHLGPESYVEFVPESDEGIGVPEVIERR